VTAQRGMHALSEFIPCRKRFFLSQLIFALDYYNHHNPNTGELKGGGQGGLLTPFYNVLYVCMSIVLCTVNDKSFTV